MILLAMLLTQAVSGAAAPALPVTQEETIVVVGRSLKVRQALADCIARHCPPKEDIALSLVEAQAQYEAGDYAASRRTLLAARRRNKGYATELPLEVAGLHRANSRMAGLNGLRDEARIGVFDIVDSLKKGLRQGDEQILLARLEVGAEFGRSGRLKAAIDQYMWVAKTARKRGNVMVEGLALFQRATLLAAAASADRGLVSDARRAMNDVTGRAEPEWLPFRNALRIVPALLAPKAQQAALMDAAIRSMEPQPGDTPQLLYAPAIDLGDTAVLSGEKTEWLDVGYSVAADGTVYDVRQLRGSERVSSAWVKAATEALSGRRYAPMLRDKDRPDPRHTERVSFVSDLIADWGTKSVTRSSDRRATARGLEAKIEQR